MCINTDQAFSFLPSGQFCFYFISHGFFPSPSKRQKLRNLKYQDTETVFVVSQATAPLAWKQ